MSYSRVVNAVLTLWEVSPILLNGCEIKGQKVCCIALVK